MFKDKADYPRSVWGAVGPRAIVSAWASGVWDGRRLYLSNGGHRDYFGNDVLAWDAEWLRFVRVTNPSPLIDFGKKTCRPETGPPSAHTYDGALWVPALQEAWFPGRFSNCGHFANFWAFDPEIADGGRQRSRRSDGAALRFTPADESSSRPDRPAVRSASG